MKTRSVAVVEAGRPARTSASPQQAKSLYAWAWARLAFLLYAFCSAEAKKMVHMVSAVKHTTLLTSVPRKAVLCVDHGLDAAVIVGHEGTILIALHRDLIAASP